MSSYVPGADYKATSGPSGSSVSYGGGGYGSVGPMWDSLMSRSWGGNTPLGIGMWDANAQMSRIMQAENPQNPSVSIQKRLADAQATYSLANAKEYSDLQLQQARAQLTLLQQAEARRQQAFSMLQGMFSNGQPTNTGVAQIDLNQIQNLAKAAGNMDTTYNHSNMQNVASNLGGVASQYQEALKGTDSTPYQAARQQAMQGLNQQFNSSLRGAGSGRAMPAFSRQAQLQDLLNSRLQGQRQIEQGLAADYLTRQQSLLQGLQGAYGAQAGVYGQDTSAYQAAQGANMNQAAQQAQMNLSGQGTNTGYLNSNRNTLLSMLQSYMGG